MPADAAALSTWRSGFGSPTLEDGTRTVLLDFAQRALADAGDELAADDLPVLLYNALRQLISDRPRRPDVLNDNRRTCCNDFSRSQLFRRAAAEAGRGLPSIEPGMPLPAGTGMSRQRFLLRSRRARALDLRADRIAPRRARGGHRARRRRAGRPDHRLDLPRRAAPTGFRCSTRPTIPLPEPAPDLALAAGARTAVHRGHAAALAPRRSRRSPTLHGEGKVAVLPAVGYTNPDQSHFTSRHYWEVGDTDPHAPDRLARPLPRRVGTQDNPLQGLVLDGQLSPSLATASVPVAAIDAPARYDLDAQPRVGHAQDRMLEAINDLGVQATGGDTARAGAGKVAVQAHRLHEQLAAVQRLRRDARCRTRAGRSPRSLQPAELIAAGLPLRCVVAQRPGQLRHARRSGDVAHQRPDRDRGTLAAFQADLEARGIADRVLVHVWSEFGRRAEENGSGAPTTAPRASAS